MTALLQDEGWRVNHRRVERIWRQEGLKAPKRRPKRSRLWFNDGSCMRRRAERRDHVWSYDVLLDRTHDGRPLRMLTVVDEWTRERLAIDVARGLRSGEMLDRMPELFVSRGMPASLRSDNGSAFTARKVWQWLQCVGVKTLCIKPRRPWENGQVESFNGKLRDELHNREIFSTLREAQALIEARRQEYNWRRPLSSLGYRPPAPEMVQIAVGLT
uniref:Transposase n=1 Tax=Eiseniibacteriota bacterium TaxID=2212470 RepID=A0A832I4A1_UNCEI